MPEPGAHGEPWVDSDDGYLMDNEGEYVYEGAYGYDVKFDHKDRAKECMNALDGMNPAALAGLVQAAEAFKCEKRMELIGSVCGECPSCKLQSALAALKGE